MKLPGVTKEQAWKRRSTGIGSSCGNYRQPRFPRVLKRCVEKLTGIYTITLKSSVCFVLWLENPKYREFASISQSLAQYLTRGNPVVNQEDHRGEGCRNIKDGEKVLNVHMVHMGGKNKKI